MGGDANVMLNWLRDQKKEKQMTILFKKKHLLNICINEQTTQ